MAVGSPPKRVIISSTTLSVKFRAWIRATSQVQLPLAGSTPISASS
ncbi:hypothetical protein [Nannocystis pusilla]